VAVTFFGAGAFGPGMRRSPVPRKPEKTGPIVPKEAAVLRLVDQRMADPGHHGEDGNHGQGQQHPSGSVAIHGQADQLCPRRRSHLTRNRERHRRGHYERQSGKEHGKLDADPLERQSGYDWPDDASSPAEKQEATED